jgi:hypothetical protein
MAGAARINDVGSGQVSGEEIVAEPAIYSFQGNHAVYGKSVSTKIEY